MPIDPGLTFFFIRHGETAWNREGRLQGQTDVPLNPLGRKQAAASGHRLAAVLKRNGIPDPSRLSFVASPLVRARDTMQIARRALRIDPSAHTEDDRLKELSFGRWEGLTWPQVKLREPAAVRERKRGKWSFVPPGGESYAVLAERLREWLPTVRPHDVVVAHGGVARCLLVILAGVPTKDAPEVDILQGRVLTITAGACRWE